MKKISIIIKTLLLTLLLIGIVNANVFASETSTCDKEAAKACYKTCPTSPSDAESACQASCNTRYNCSNVVKDENLSGAYGTQDKVTKNFWWAASSWFKNSKQFSDADVSNLDSVKSILDEFLDYINIIGTTVIVCITIILGIKFLFGSVEGQTSAKQGLITLLVACVFFFGWNSLKNILYPDNNFILISSDDQSIRAPAARALSYVKFFGNILAFIAIVYVGIKYIFSGASGKADLKKQSVQFIIGIILTFATINFLTFISDVILDVLN